MLFYDVQLGEATLAGQVQYQCSDVVLSLLLED